jgi:hypothetical protein
MPAIHVHHRDQGTDPPAPAIGASSLVARIRPTNVVVHAANTFTCNGLCRTIVCPSITAVAKIVRVAKPVGAVPLFSVSVALCPPVSSGGHAGRQTRRRERDKTVDGIRAMRNATTDHCR